MEGGRPVEHVLRVSSYLSGGSLVIWPNVLPLPPPAVNSILYSTLPPISSNIHFSLNYCLYVL